MKRTRELEQMIAEVHTEHVRFRFADGCCVDAPLEVVNNSKLLCEALYDSSDGRQTSLQVPRGVLQRWVRCGDQNQPFTAQFLKVQAH